MQGWIKLHRKILESPVFDEPGLLKLWIYCLTKAAHKNQKVLIGQTLVELEPGQFITGRNALSDDYNNGIKPKNKVSDITLWRWLLLLEKMGNLNIEKTNKYSIVTVDKWVFYQGSDNDNEQQDEQQMNNKRTTNEQQMNTNKNVNKANNAKNDKEEIILSAFDSFWSVYPRKLDKKKAFEKFKSAAKKHHPQIIIDGAANYAKQCEVKKTEKEFIKHPTTFLNAESFLNDFDLSPGYQPKKEKSIYEQGEESKRRQALAEANFKPRTLTPEEQAEEDEMLPF